MARMGKLLKTDELAPVKPSYPRDLEGKIREEVKALGDRFKQQVQQHFRLPPRRRWTIEAWQVLDRLVDSAETGNQNGKAKLFCVDETQYSKLIDLEGDGTTFDVLLASLMHSRDYLGPGFEFPGVGSTEDASLDCYAEAIKYSQQKFCENERKNIQINLKDPDYVNELSEVQRAELESREVSLAERVEAMKKGKEKLTREQMAHLLYLFKQNRWFVYRMLENDKLSKRQRKDYERKRDQIAATVRAQAEARLGHATDIADARVYLEELERAWGVGWYLAVHVIDYGWEV